VPVSALDECAIVVTTLGSTRTDVAVFTRLYNVIATSLQSAADAAAIVVHDVAVVALLVDADHAVAAASDEDADRLVGCADLV
jgi:hypothetical protein